MERLMACGIGCARAAQSNVSATVTVNINFAAKMGLSLTQGK